MKRIIHQALVALGTTLALSACGGSGDNAAVRTESTDSQPVSSAASAGAPVQASASNPQPLTSTINGGAATPTSTSEPQPATSSVSGGAATSTSEPQPATSSVSGGAATSTSEPQPATSSVSGGAATSTSEPQPATSSVSGGAATSTSEPQPATSSVSGGAAGQTASSDPQAATSTAKVQVVAHRGGAAYAPENTIVAFLNGYRLGADAIEFDIRLNASGDLVVAHDDDLGRTTNCKFGIASSQTSALDGCDAAYKWSPAFRSDSPPGFLAGRGIGVPLLRSVLEAMDLFTAPPATLWIEIKNTSPYSPAVIQTTVRKLVEVLSERLWRARVVLQSFDSYTLSQFKIRYSGSDTVLLWGPISGSSYTCSAAVADAARRQIDILGIPPLQLPIEEAKECVTQAKQNGLRVAFYTLNREQDFVRTLELEPDAVISDFPACLQSLLGRPSLSNPYPAELASGALQPKCWR